MPFPVQILPLNAMDVGRLGYAYSQLVPYCQNALPYRVGLRQSEPEPMYA